MACFNPLVALLRQTGRPRILGNIRKTGNYQERPCKFLQEIQNSELPDIIYKLQEVYFEDKIPSIALSEERYNKVYKDLLTIYKEQVDGHPITLLPCGQCIGCKLDNARNWAFRGTVEQMDYSTPGCFVTYTYDDEHRPEDHLLHHTDFTALRKAIEYRFQTNPRFLMCGEYGTKTAREHFHSCYFGWTPDDLTLKSNGYYHSDKLQDAWGKGFITIIPLSTNCISYVARYNCKLVVTDFNQEVAEKHAKSRQYVQMSRQPGIGYSFYKNYKSDLFSGDFVVLNGKKYKTPRYYEKLLEKDAPLEFEAYKTKKLNSIDFSASVDLERLANQELCRIEGFHRLNAEKIHGF